jgi:amino acid transporter
VTVGYWDQEGKISVGVWIAIFWLAIVVINLFGTLGYAEEEFWSAVIKLSAIVIFIIISLVLVLGGGPKGKQSRE